MSVLHLGRRNDSGDLAGVVSEIASVGGAQSGRIVTAVRNGQGRLKLISWQVSGTGPISRLADSGNQAGTATNIDIARGTRVVTACRSGSGNLLLISWDVAATGAITRRGDSGSQAGTATAIRIVAVSDTLFVTACRAGDGRLLLISWRLNSNGSLTRLADSGSAAGAIGEVSLLKLSSERILTSVRDGGGNLKLITWQVSATGAITRLGDSGSQAGTASMIQSTFDPAGRVVTSVRDGSGNLLLIAWGISSNGATVQRLGDSGSAAGAIGGNGLTTRPDGVVSAVRAGDGSLLLIGWNIAGSGAVERRSDSGTQAGTASLINVLSITGVTGVALVTAVRTASNTLKLIAWGPASVRLHTKILQSPTNFTVNQMVAAMTQVYASVGIGVQQVTTENLNLANTFLDIDIGECVLGSTTTEQNQLFSNRNNVGPDDVVVYFVRSTVPPKNGCATHPSGRPGAVVASVATRWTLGHEVGHVLGLLHVSDNNRLMTGNGTSNITNPPPDLVASEVSTMQSSRLTVPS